MAFTPVASLTGGLMIGASAATCILVDGKIAGISGIVGPLLRSLALQDSKPGALWKATFVLGLVLGGLGSLALDADTSYPSVPDFTWWRYVISGICVGVGTRLGSGCTSGHGICGLARLSLRSFAAVPTFMGFGVATAILFCGSDHCDRSPGIAPLAWPVSVRTPLVAVGVSSSLLLLVAAMPRIRAHVAAPVAGIVFGLGLGTSGMTSQEKVLGFLCVTGTWDPSLAFVMGGALLITFPAFALTRRDGRLPLTEGLKFEKPQTYPVDFQLMFGNALFGIGWGLCGVCPGPALAAALPYTIRFAADGSGWLFAMNLVVIILAWLACDRILSCVLVAPAGMVAPKP